MPIEPQFGHDDGLDAENELGHIPFACGQSKSGNCAFWRPLFISHKPNFAILADPANTAKGGWAWNGPSSLWEAWLKEADRDEALMEIPHMV